MGEIKTLLRPIPISQIDAIVLDPDGDAPAIAYWLKNGDRVLDVHNDDDTCQEIWNIMEEGLSNQDFLKYNNMFLRIDAIECLEMCNTPELGLHLAFSFANGRKLFQQYNDQSQIIKDCLAVSEILAAMQDLRASGGRPTSQH